MSTPTLHLETLFVLDANGRLVSTREPQPGPAPLFTLVRGRADCAWAVRADVPADIADELDRLAREEMPISNLSGVDAATAAAPLHADRYVALLQGIAGNGPNIWSGPAFIFPDTLPVPFSGTIPAVTLVEDERMLKRHFRGWVPGEIAAGRAPVMAVVEEGSHPGAGYPVSVAFSSRWSPVAAEAGVETAEGFRGRGLGPRVTGAWAEAVRALGRTPLYSTAWSNAASLALARKLSLEMYAADWSVRDGSG